MRSILVAAIGLLMLVQPAWLAAQESSPAEPAPSASQKTPPLKSRHIASTDPLPPQQQREKFHLPPGFTIQLVAAEPEIQKPINIAFDCQGRLWATGSELYPFAAPEDQPGKDTVSILSDFGPDGRARKVTTFADDLNIPIGVLPTAPGEALVYSIPSVYRMVDTDGDGRADQREVLYTKYGHEDTHGMTGEFTWGLDGWIYCCHGFSNTSQVKSRGDTEISMTSGNTYRIRPDGSRIEHFTFGQTNPFGLVFDALGNLYSCDCHTRPIYLLLRGSYYPSFGRPHDGMGFGPEMLEHTHGSTAIAGIATYAAQQFPQEFRDNIFVGNVVTNRINRDRIEWHGASPRAIEMPDFVTCDDPWFRPVDIQLGPDGALYVADFYNRIIGHYEVPLTHPERDHSHGRIWRIVYQGPADQPPPPVERDLSKASVAELVADLASDNLTVRSQATQQLVARGEAIADDVQPLFATGSPTQQAHALWVLERIGKLADDTLATAAKNSDPLVRVHTIRILGGRPTLAGSSLDLVLAALRDRDAQVQRAAVEALAAHPAPNCLEPLLQVRRQVSKDDTHLLHAVRLALRDQLNLQQTWAHILAGPLPDEDAEAVADVCPGVANTESAQFLTQYLEKHRESLDNLARYCRHVGRYGGALGLSDQVLEHIGKMYQDDPVSQAIALQGVEQGLQAVGKSLSQADIARADTLTQRLLDADDPKSVELGIELASNLRLAKRQQQLLALGQDTQRPDELRKDALAALVTADPQGQVTALLQMLNDAQQSLNVREQIAKSLAATNDVDVQTMLLEALRSVPARLQSSIALGLAGSTEGGERLLAAVANGKASARLLQETAVVLRLKHTRIPDVDERLKQLTMGLTPIDQRLENLLKQRRLGFNAAPTDVALGAKVFAKNCATCHQVANQGGKIGPQLDGVGIRGLDRLLEDVLDPSRNVDQGFRLTTLVLDDGNLVSGLLVREEGEVLVVADAQGKEIRVPGGSVEERSVAQLSPMPSNFAEVLSEADFYNLVRFLLDQRVKE